MSHARTAERHRACGTCNDTGLVETSIYNTATGQTITSTETCLDCP
jgi:hypothetical protein